jgi:hypothetical protein
MASLVSLTRKISEVPASQMYRSCTEITVEEKTAEDLVPLPGQTKIPPMGIDDLSTEHMANWFECMRSRQQPHCTVKAEFGHGRQETVLGCGWRNDRGPRLLSEYQGTLDSIGAGQPPFKTTQLGRRCAARAMTASSRMS